MNCFQKLGSLIFGTTENLTISHNYALWIAFKSWSLWYSEQPISSKDLPTRRCELLSKVGIFDIRNNFMKCIKPLLSLWIAFKSWYLWYSEQLPIYWYSVSCRCELRSKVGIFDIRNNAFALNATLLRVVNCFQKLVSLIFGTTTAQGYIWHTLLWIAFKSWYLWYSEQLVNPLSVVATVVNCFQKLVSLIFGTTLLP